MRGRACPLGTGATRQSRAGPATRRLAILEAARQLRPGGVLGVRWGAVAGRTGAGGHVCGEKQA